MKLFGFEISRKSSTEGSIDAILSRLHAIYATVSGISVTPESCMKAPTVQALINAVTRRMATLPVQVLKKGVSNGRETKEVLPSHPVAKLLRAPNDWQTDANYWMDAVSWFMRYGNHYSYKARGKTGPILRLMPLHPADVEVKSASMWERSYQAHTEKGIQDYTSDEIHHVRGPARNGLCGDSVVQDIKEAIAMEIAAEQFGAAFFGNGAMPFLVFKFIQGMKGFKSDEDKKAFVEDFQAMYTRGRQFKSFILPPGMEMSEPISAENNKAQFLETRKYQRTVIAGAWGVPPHLVGDLERGTFNNVEQQSLDFVVSVILPIIRIFESAMERDLLTPSDRNSGIIVRFNVDAALRGDFKTRQEGLAIQRQWGIISADEWRERENMNPRLDEDGEPLDDSYLEPLNYLNPAKPPPEPVAPPGKPGLPAATDGEGTDSPAPVKAINNVLKLLERHS